MAKKTRRSDESDIRLSPSQMVQPGMEAEATASPGNTSSSALQDEYRYVIADLKRIGIIAVAMLVILIALALVLT